LIKKFSNNPTALFLRNEQELPPKPPICYDLEHPVMINSVEGEVSCKQISFTHHNSGFNKRTRHDSRLVKLEMGCMPKHCTNDFWSAGS
jgi:hypothetical protein